MEISNLSRSELELQARKILGAGVKLDGLDDLALKKATILKQSPGMAVHLDGPDGKNAVYVNAAFDYAIADADKQAQAFTARPVTVPGARADGRAFEAEVPDARAAKARMEEGHRNAWKQEG